MSQSEKQDRVVYHRPTTRTVFCVIALLCTLGDLYALRPPTSLDIACYIL